jgi:mRNA-degrading endonuclease RelE of RelBE toxin-antitoxin system
LHIRTGSFPDASAGEGRWGRTITPIPANPDELMARTTKRLYTLVCEEPVNALVRDPEPPGSVALGDGLVRRLHIGDYGVAYEVSDDTVRVWSLGRTPG